MIKAMMFFFGLLILCSCNNSNREKTSDADSTQQPTGLPPEDNHVMENNVSTQHQSEIDEEKLRMLDPIKAFPDHIDSSNFVSSTDSAMAIPTMDTVKK